MTSERLFSRMRMTVAATAALLALSTSGCTCFFWCHDGTGVQRDYVSERDECQDQAETKVGLFIDPTKGAPNPKQRNSMLLALFAECMHAKDWGVTAPKKDDDMVIVEGPGYGGPDVTVRARTNPDGTPVVSDGPMVGTGVGPGFGSPPPSNPNIGTTRDQFGQLAPYDPQTGAPPPAPGAVIVAPPQQTPQQTMAPPPPLPGERQVKQQPLGAPPPYQSPRDVAQPAPTTVVAPAPVVQEAPSYPPPEPIPAPVREEACNNPEDPACRQPVNRMCGGQPCRQGQMIQVQPDAPSTPAAPVPNLDLKPPQRYQGR